VNRISQQMVEELVVDNTPETSRGIIGLCNDASTGLFYAYDESSIFQVWVLISCFGSCHQCFLICSFA